MLQICKKEFEYKPSHSVQYKIYFCSKIGIKKIKNRENPVTIVINYNFPINEKKAIIT